MKGRLKLRVERRVCRAGEMRTVGGGVAKATRMVSGTFFLNKVKERDITTTLGFWNFHCSLQSPARRKASKVPAIFTPVYATPGDIRQPLMKGRGPERCVLARCTRSL